MSVANLSQTPPRHFPKQFMAREQQPNLLFRIFCLGVIFGNTHILNFFIDEFGEDEFCSGSECKELPVSSFSVDFKVLVAFLVLLAGSKLYDRWYGPKGEEEKYDEKEGTANKKEA